MRPIHLILPDPVERAACFRSLTKGAARIVRSFSSADAWCDANADADEGNSILLFHWRQPGRMGGAALLDHLARRPAIAAFVAADRLSIAEARAILRGGVRDLLPAPLNPQGVRRVIDDALAAEGELLNIRTRHGEAVQHLAALSPRQHEILDALAAGLGTKAIARQFNLSPRTVEVHRANIMRRAGARSVAELLRWRFVTEFFGSTPRNSIHIGD